MFYLDFQKTSFLTYLRLVKLTADNIQQQVADSQSSNDVGLHQCHFCTLDNQQHPVQRFGKRIHNFDHVFTCVDCELAHHLMCLPAGSILRDGLSVSCSRHLPIKYERKVIPLCFFCEKEGKILHCKFCPMAFHENCLPSDGGKLFVCLGVSVFYLHSIS